MKVRRNRGVARNKNGRQPTKGAVLQSLELPATVQVLLLLPARCGEGNSPIKVRQKVVVAIGKDGT